MNDALFYALTFESSKKEIDYLKGVEKALFSKATCIQIDEQILLLPYSQNLIKQIDAKNLDIAIKIKAANTSEEKLVSLAKYPRHIYVSHSQELERIGNLNQVIQDSDIIVLEGRRATDFRSTLQRLGKIFRQRLHLSFSVFSNEDKDSLSTSEIANTIKRMQLEFPDFQIRTLKGIEPYDSRIDPQVELEPLLIDPCFEIQTERSQNIQFSFVIPTFNSKYFLLNVIRHILLQDASADEYEILIVDDGSTDGSQSFIQSYLFDNKVSNNIRYFYWPKPHLPTQDKIFRAGLSRNLGVNQARGKYIVFLDSDILIPRFFLNELRQNFLNNKDVVQYVRHHIPYQFSNAHVSFGDVQKGLSTYIEEKKYWQPFFEAADWMAMDFYWKYTCTYCLALRKEDFFSVGRFRRTFVSYGFEDTDLGYRLHMKGLNFYLSPTITLHLTPPPKIHGRSQVGYERFNALSKTAKIFYRLNLDPEIYQHFRIFMGGEVGFLKKTTHLLGKFFSKNSKDLAKPQM